MNEGGPRDRVQSIERGMAVLHAFGERGAPASGPELAALTGLPRPVVRRILLTFESLGYVRQDGGLWTLTPRVLNIGAGYFERSSLPEISYPFLSDAVDRTGETCSVGVLEGADVVHVARIEARRAAPDAVRIGMRLPAHATAIGKTLLAELPERELDDYLATVVLTRFTPETIADPAVLRARIAAVRDDGYDLSSDELHPGMLAIAVPIRVEQTTIGALTASSTSMRTSAETLTHDVLPILRETSTAIARAFRGANPHRFHI